MITALWFVGAVLTVGGAYRYLHARPEWRRSVAFYDAAVDAPPAPYDHEPETAWRARIARLREAVENTNQKLLHNWIAAAFGIGILGGLILSALFGAQ